MIAAIFDLDGTLYTGHIVRGITQHHQHHRVQRLPLYVYLVSHTALWPLWRLGLLSEAVARDLWARHLGWPVRGWTPAEAESAFRWVAEQYVLPRVRADVLARLREHQAAGQRVILTSGTPEPLLAQIGKAIGVHEVVGTRLVEQDGRYTGAAHPPVCQGAGKVARLGTYLRSTGAIAWEQSYAYADSYTDLPLLERVGHPVAVYPDVPLAACARGRGWEILGEETPTKDRRF